MEKVIINNIIITKMSEGKILLTNDSTGVDRINIELSGVEKELLLSCFTLLENVIRNNIEPEIEKTKEKLTKETELENTPICENDLVLIADVGGTYTTYTKWIVDNINPDDIGCFVRGKLPNCNEIYKVVKIAKHSDNYNTKLAYICSPTGQSYIIKVSSLRLLKKEI